MMTMTKRRVTKPVYVGGVKVGGGADITVQSMTKTDTRDVKATVRQIHELEEAGCEIIRSAVPDMEAAKAMAEIKKQIHIPLVADIHFHYQLALECAARRRGLPASESREPAERGPGARGGGGSQRAEYPHQDRREFRQPAAGGRHRPGREGFSRHMDLVNQLPKAGEAQEGDYSVVDHMVATALWEISLLEQQDFEQIKISMKAFDVPTTVEAYRRLSEMVPYPLHLGITEAGTAKSGSIRTAVGPGRAAVRGHRRHHPGVAERRQR